MSKAKHYFLGINKSFPAINEAKFITYADGTLLSCDESDEAMLIVKELQDSFYRILIVPVWDDEIHSKHVDTPPFKVPDSLTSDVIPAKYIDSFAEHITFSRITFGPVLMTSCDRVCNHIEKEVKEVKESLHSPEEWVDVFILAFDGLQRAVQLKLEEQNGEGDIDPLFLAAKCFDYFRQKMATNKKRKWPNWYDVSPTTPIEHKKD